jgi:hypothetical protein
VIYLEIKLYVTDKVKQVVKTQNIEVLSTIAYSGLLILELVK